MVPEFLVLFMAVSRKVSVSRKVHRRGSEVSVIFEGMKDGVNVLEVLGESGGGTGITMPLWERLQWGLNKIIHIKVLAA